MATRRSMSTLTKSAILAVTTKTRPSSASPLLSRSLSSSPRKNSVHYSFCRPQIQHVSSLTFPGSLLPSRSGLGSFSNKLSSLKIVRPFCSDGWDLFDVIFSSFLGESESTSDGSGTSVNFLKNLGDDHVEADELVAQIETDNKEMNTVEPGNKTAVDISKSAEGVKDDVVVPSEKIEEEEEEEEEEDEDEEEEEEKVEASTVEKVEEEEAAKVAATAPASPNEGSIFSWMKEVVMDVILGAAILAWYQYILIVATWIFLVVVVLEITEFLKGAYQELHEAGKNCSEHQVSPFDEYGYQVSSFEQGYLY